MKLEKAINIEDLHRMAKRRLPKVAFDFLEGGVEDELGIARNESAFARLCLMPRYLVDVTRRDQTAKLFDRVYSSPFGISPTGAAGLFRHGADLMLAESAARANIPFIMSGASTASIEAAAQIAPSHTWYQLYVAHDSKISEDLIRRARDAGLGTLVLTVDVPVSAKRERNIRNGFGRPLKMTLPIMLEALTHPRWMAEYLRYGTPLVENWAPYAPPGSNADQVADFVATQMPSVATWADLEKFRKLWPRHLVVKGILNKDDAIRAADLGVDGIIVSNHGGRQLDRAPASIEVLPTICEAVGDRITVMLDSGVRRGSDIVIALALGARFVFVGRATLYGAAAAGIAGVRKAINILRREIDLTMAQIGCPSLDQLDSSFVYDGRG
jgi:(S)-mandelate dehydrogenase